MDTRGSSMFGGGTKLSGFTLSGAMVDGSAVVSVGTPSSDVTLRDPRLGVVT